MYHDNNGMTKCALCPPTNHSKVNIGLERQSCAAILIEHPSPGWVIFRGGRMPWCLLHSHTCNYGDDDALARSRCMHEHALSGLIVKDHSVRD